MKVFIEKCLVPASQRLSADELLKDPFLQINNITLDIPITMLPNVGGFTTRSVILEEPKNTRLKDNDESPLSTFIENSACYSHVPCLEIHMAYMGNDFKLKGKVNDEKSVSLKLRIAEQDGNFLLIFYYVQF